MSSPGPILCRVVYSLPQLSPIHPPYSGINTIKSTLQLPGKHLKLTPDPTPSACLCCSIAVPPPGPMCFQSISGAFDPDQSRTEDAMADEALTNKEESREALAFITRLVVIPLITGALISRAITDPVLSFSLQVWA